MANQEIEVKLMQTRQGIGVDVKSGGGLSKVIHDDTLKGDGTIAEPLGIADSILENITSTATALQEEIDSRTNADKELSDKIDTLEDDLTADIDSLTTIVENNYTTLDNRITEVAESLQESIEENVVALQQEDTALQNQINAHSQTLTAYDTRITNNTNTITQEISDRQDADSDLQDQIDNLSGRGRFLSLWNCAEGKPETEPDYDEAYTYKTGDYFIVGAVASGEAKNYKPTGTTYTKGQAASTVEETDEVSVDDTYYYDGSTWHLQVNHGKTVSFANLAGEPSDNNALANALNAKQDVLTQGTNISITAGEDGTVTISATDTTYSQGTGITISAHNEISVTDYNTIVSNAEVGAGAATTISGYGDIVTHNASEFATPSDIPTKTSDLENDSGFLTSSDIATTSTVGVVKPDGTTITVTEDGTISATAQETDYRGRWVNYASVPTDSSLYPEDFHNNRKPTNNDFIVISDTSDYVTPEELEKGFSAVNLHPTTAFTMVFTDEEGVVHNCYYNDYNGKWVKVSDEYSLWYTPGVPGRWNIKTNKESDTKVIINGVPYDVDPSSTTTTGTPVLVRTNDSAAPVYGGLPPVAGQYQGTWRFAYSGVWDTDGKNGWKPQYQIEDTLPIASETQLGGVMTDGNTTSATTTGVISSIGNTLQSGGYQKYWEGTKAEFDAIETKDENTIYQILDDIVDIVTEIPTATRDDIGLVKPDGTTITINDTGVISTTNMAKTDLTNVRGAYDWVITSVTYGGGESGYRKWRNGYLEQWGKVTSGANGEVEFNLHQPYKDMTFSIFAQVGELGNYFVSCYPSGNQKFKLRVQSSSGYNMAVKVMWRSFGYAE